MQTTALHFEARDRGSGDGLTRANIAAVAVTGVALIAAWAAHLGPFGSSSSVASLVAAREEGSTASCRSIGQIEADGGKQRVYRCQVTLSKSSSAASYVSACYWIQQDRAIKIMVSVPDLGC